MAATQDSRVLLVHERLTELGGSEAVVQSLAQVFPRAELYVPIADSRISVPELDGMPRTLSFAQHFYRAGKGYAHLLPILPLAMRYAPITPEDYTAIVVSHHAFANRIRVPAGIPTVSYIHSPARWIWDAGMRTGEAGRLGSLGLELFAASQKRPDRRAAARMSTLVANSHAVRRRINEWWHLEADVVPPPVDTGWYTPEAVQREDFFLLAGRLVPYKRPEVAVAAAREAGVRLVVAGEGRQMEICKKVAGPGTQFLGRVSNSQLRDLFRRCKALLFPGHEDFGIVPVEAQACGTPVIALGVGGALDTVLPSVSGQLVPPTGSKSGDVRGFAAQLRAFEISAWNSGAIREHAQSFSRENFQFRMGAIVNAAIELAKT